MKFSTIPVLLFMSFYSKPALSQTKEVPVSLSYSQLIKCYPELKNESWSRKVDLNELKEEIDRHFLTTQSLLRQREVVLKDPASGASKRLRLAAQTKSGKSAGVNYNLTLEKLDASGSGIPIVLPARHRTNPKQQDLNTYFANHEVLQDETSYFDTKLRGVSASYKKNFKDVFEIELKDSQSSRRVFCENKKDLGIVCTCFPK